MAELVIEEYGLSADEVEVRFLAEEAIDSIAVIRRARIESGLVRLRGLYPSVVQVEGVRNRTMNHRHREVYVSGWAITQSKIEAPNGPIRKADFRDTLAEAAQTTAWRFGDEPDSAQVGEVAPWACLVHMPADRHQDQPGTLRFAFPLPDGTWEDHIDLYYWIPELRGYAESDYVLQLRDQQRRRWAS